VNSCNFLRNNLISSSRPCNCILDTRSWAILGVCLLIFLFLLLSAAVTTISARCRVEDEVPPINDGIDDERWLREEAEDDMMMMMTSDGSG